MAEFVETTMFLTSPDADYLPVPGVPAVSSARQVTDISVLLNSLDEAAAERLVGVGEARRAHMQDGGGARKRRAVDVRDRLPGR